MTDQPIGNGRDTRARFAPENAGGPGNPHAAKVTKLRSALLNAVTEEDVRDGRVLPTRIYLDRVTSTSSYSPARSSSVTLRSA